MVDLLAQQFDKALKLYFDRNFQEALELFRDLEKKDLDQYLQVQVPRRIGSCLCELQMTEEGIKYLLQAVELSKKYSMDGQEDMWVLQSLAEGYAKSKEFDKALGIYKKIIEGITDPEDFDYVTYEYECLLDEYKKYKMKDVMELKKIRFFEEVDAEIEKIDKEIDKERQKLIQNKQKLEV